MAITDNISNLISAGSYGDALSSISNIGDGVGGIIKKIKSLSKNQKDPGTIRDLNTNGFLSNDSLFVPDFFSRTFDEPTYLTFRVEFNFGDNDSLYRNLAYNNNGISFGGAYDFFNEMYDHMPEPFLEPYRIDTNLNGFASSELVYDEETNEFTGGDFTIDASAGRTYSTERYLDVTLGEHGRAALLHNFKLALKDIQDNFPYYLKSISGLGKLFQVDPTTGIRLKDVKIGLDCYEALDLRITQLLNMYKKIVWDDVYQRWILPDMMRYFNMKIYISEIRTFHDVIPSKKKNEYFVNDYTNPNIRNATSAPLMGDKDKWWEKGLNGLNTATALSNSFLGTKSMITKAVNAVASTVDTAKGLYNDIAGAITDLNMCNNAFNEIMPTICIDCHMCEFDISDIMSHIDSLKSYKPEQPAPKITIKVGNAKDVQVYPLNKSLKIVGDGYAKTINEYAPKDSSTSLTYSDLYGLRDDANGFMYMGNYLVDDALTSKYKNSNVAGRVKEYSDTLQYYIGQTKAQTPMNKRMNKHMRNDISSMSYPRGYTPKELARMSLTTAGIQEAQSLVSVFDKNKDDNFDSTYIIGTHSTATSPDKAARQAVEVVGETLNQALEKIYNGDEVKSMALSDEMKNKISSGMFDAYVEKLKETSAINENSILHKILDEYEVIKLSNNDHFSTTQDETLQIHENLDKYEVVKKFNELN